MSELNLFGLAAILESAVGKIAKNNKKALKQIAVRIEKTAKSEIGHYQRAGGGFPAWAKLEESTIADKTRGGFSPPDNPLLRTGEMLNSIKHEVNESNLSAIIGSTDEKMFFHEFGTSKMAMRPVIGPAAFRNRKFIEKKALTATVSGIFENREIPEDIHDSLGYNYDVDN